MRHSRDVALSHSVSRSTSSIGTLFYHLPILQNRGDNGTLLVNEPGTIDDFSGLQGF